MAAFPASSAALFIAPNVSRMQVCRAAQAFFSFSACVVANSLPRTFRYVQPSRTGLAVRGSAAVRVVALDDVENDALPRADHSGVNLRASSCCKLQQAAVAAARLYRDSLTNGKLTANASHCTPEEITVRGIAPVRRGYEGVGHVRGPDLHGRRSRSLPGIP